MLGQTGEREFETPSQKTNFSHPPTSDHSSMNNTGLRTVQTGERNAQLVGNGISTRKYTWASFLPVSLLFQFRSISNAYFLMTAGITLIPNVSPVSPFSAIAPLIFVLMVSEIREFVEEYQKNRRDVQTNTTPIVRLVKPADGGDIVFETTTWQSLHPGDIVLLYDRDKIPADLCLVYSSANNFSYVETSNLDGETNLKTREPPQLFDNLAVRKPDSSGSGPHDYDFSGLFGHKLSFEPPNPDMYRFKGSVGDGTLSVGNIMLRGCSMRNTPWALGVCVYTGHESKAMLNSTSAGVVPSKKTNVERRMNMMVLMVFAVQFMLILGSTVGYAGVSSGNEFTAWYLMNTDSMSNGLIALTFFVLLNTIIPMSMWVSLEVLKFFQATLMEADMAMKDPVRKLSCLAHSKNLNEELGQVTHVFTDKTGTLTCNRMEFKGCAIAGRLFTADASLVDEEELAEANLAVAAGGVAKSVKRRALGFSGAIPIHSSLLDLIGSSIERRFDSPESEFFKCIALCHSCERVEKHAELSEKPEKRKGSLLFGWFSPPKKKEGDVVVGEGEVGGGSKVGSLRTKRGAGLAANPGVSTVYRPTSLGGDSDSDDGEDGTQRSVDSVDQKLAKFTYQSTSPDEAALVSSAADIGYFFHKRLPSAVQVDIHGKAHVFEILHQVAFTSDRRMMSVVVRLKDSDRVVVYSKGADSSVIPKCNPGEVERHTQWSVDIFAEKGFRTLCLARREMSVAEWNVFDAKIRAASANLDTRDQLVAVIDQELEEGLSLLGCTAVEDKLQPGVHETVAALRAANITVCMITGDKRETAINIARSCKLVNSDHNVYTMSTQDNMYGGGNFIHLDSLAQLVGDGRADPLWGMTTEGHGVVDETRPVLHRKESLPVEEKPAAGLTVSAGQKASTISLSPLAKEAQLMASPAVSRVSHSVSAARRDNNKFCIVLDGAALSILLSNPNQTKKLLSVMAHPQCEAAVFCRVNPKQKGLIVKSCRNRLESGCVLAIGDGANDISMIKEAHVGVGIYGEEGWQAAGSADYAITKFKDLYRLLFVHGRWNYVRITFFISFFMYKNFAFTFMQFWMASFSQWTGVSIFNDISLLAFNSVFMVGPLFAAGLFDKDLHPDAERPSKRTMLHPLSVTDEKWYVRVVPRLYSPGQKNELFKTKRVFGWLILGLVHSLCFFFIIVGSWAVNGNVAIQADGMNASFPMTQQALYTILLMTLSGLHCMMIREWNIVYAICTVLLHVILYIAFVGVYDGLYAQPYGFIAAATFGNWNFWFTFALVVAVCVLPLVFLKRIKQMLHPVLIDVIRSKALTVSGRRKSMRQLSAIRCDPSELNGL